MSVAQLNDLEKNYYGGERGPIYEQSKKRLGFHVIFSKAEFEECLFTDV